MRFQITLVPTIEDIAVGHLNGDGLPDIVVANGTTNEVTVILSQNPEHRSGFSKSRLEPWEKCFGTVLPQAVAAANLADVAFCVSQWFVLL
jgi:hypothetical protein